MSIISDLEMFKSRAGKCFNRKTCNTSKIYEVSYAIRPLRILLTLVILFYIILSPTAASSLSLIPPAEIDVSEDDVYEMNFISSDDAHSLSALLQVPDEFSYAGNAKIIWKGTISSCEPYESGQSLQWDLSIGHRLRAIYKIRGLLFLRWDLS